MALTPGTTTDNTAVHVVSKGDLVGGARVGGWRDPDGIASISAAKRAAMLANPFLGGDDDPVQLVGTRGDRVIGRMDIIPGLIDTPGGAVRCLWGSAFFVPVEFRSTLMGVTLVLRMERLGESTGAAGASRLAYPLYEKLGYLDFHMPRYVLLRRSRPVVDRYVRVPAAAATSAAVVNVGLRVHNALLAGVRAVQTRGLTSRRVDEFPGELARRLEENRPSFSMHRSPTWFKWLLEHTFFDGEQHLRELYLVVDGSDDVVAYFLVKARLYDEVMDGAFRNVYLGSLHDWLIFDQRAITFPQLVMLAIEAMSRWNIDAIEVCLPHDAQPLDLRRWGFVPAGAMHVLVKPARGSELAEAPARRPQDWLVRPGEGDYTFS